MLKKHIKDKFEFIGNIQTVEFQVTKVIEAII
jgi:hypothetical protein